MSCVIVPLILQCHTLNGVKMSEFDIPPRQGHVRLRHHSNLNSACQPVPAVSYRIIKSCMSFYPLFTKPDWVQGDIHYIMRMKECDDNIP